MRTLIAGAVAALATCSIVQAQNKTFDAAEAFGTRPSLLALTLSPDGKSVAYVGSTKGAGTVVITAALETQGAHLAYAADGKPQRVQLCSWLTNDRLVCDTAGVDKDPTFKFLPYSSKVAFDASGGNIQGLGKFQTFFGMQMGGSVLDTVPVSGAVLMTHQYVPANTGALGSRAGSAKNGLGVDLVDTRSVESKSIEPPNDTAVFYLGDGQGNVRIMALDPSKGQGGFGFGPPPGAAGGGMGSTINYLYRTPGSRAWHALSTFKMADQSGFQPLAIDAGRNVAYGFKKKDGHTAVYSVKLDESLAEELVYARDDGDVTGLVRYAGRGQRVIGASYLVNKVPQVHYFDPQIEHLMAVFAKAVPDETLELTDASDDLGRMLVLAYNDADPGIYYLFDRDKRKLEIFQPVRKPLEGVLLAPPKAVSYPAADGVSVSASLLLPPGKPNGKGLPAIVLSDVGTGAKDAKGFDWLAQFFANSGYAVLLPAFRGTDTFGEVWNQKGYASWSVAVGDVLAGARWLVSTGVADPKKLATAGWSSGGYLALQAAVVEPDLFKAVIAIAPYTDLGTVKRTLPDGSPFIGNSSSEHEGSPVARAAAFKAPVLLFHGAMDMAAAIDESKSLDEKLKSAGKAHELVTFDTLDHVLSDSDARVELLRKSQTFLHSAGL